MIDYLVLHPDIAMTANCLILGIIIVVFWLFSKNLMVFLTISLAIPLVIMTQKTFLDVAFRNTLSTETNVVVTESIRFPGNDIKIVANGKTFVLEDTADIKSGAKINLLHQSTSSGKVQATLVNYGNKCYLARNTVKENQ